MLGQLIPDAVCPLCNTPLLAIIDEGSIQYISRIIRREYHHAKPGPHQRRKRFCTRTFVGRTETLLADNERRFLGVQFTTH